jgi:hypothetical protein
MTSSGSRIAPTASILAKGEAIDVKRNQFDAAAGAEGRKDGVAALAAIRYADPASWTTATAVAHAIAAHREAVLAAHDRVGVIVTSADGPVEAIAAMCEASKAGSSSPIRFPASNAGSLTGLSSIAFTFRGPTLMLTMPPDRGAPVALLLADAWIQRGQAEYVVVAACGRVDGKPAARCVLVSGPQAGAIDRDEGVAWLASSPGPAPTSESGKR